ncbi:MAG TPA: ABC transporter ATP-binding protein [Candidatus Veblenbacteria bacterium]|nr:ABC transporter ATP-binding protein [Candidatus Veblenbacteria bacterium]
MELLWQYLRRYKKLLWGALTLATVNQVFSLLDPQIFRLLIDNYGTKAGTIPANQFMSGVILLLLAFVGVAFVSRVAKNFQDYYVNVITQRLGATMYANAVEHSFSLPYAAFEDQRSGELLQKLQKARTDSQTFIIGAINTVFLSTIGIIFVLSYAWSVDWRIGLTYFLIMPTLGLITYLISRRIKQAQTAIVKRTAELAGSTTETLRNVELVKSLGLETQETARLNTVNEQILKLELTKVKMIRKLLFTQGTMLNGLRALLMLLMLWLISQGEITLGQFFSLLFYSFFLFNPLAEFGQVITQYQEARASLEQMKKVLALEPEPVPANPKTIDRLNNISFDKVSFAYGQNSEPHTLHEINLSLQPGKTTAFVGPSGSGKSTLIKLLVGLYHPTGGQLKVSGLDMTEIDTRAFRRRLGYVSQETQLFAGTIRENLLFVNPQATDEQCLTALRAAAALPIIERGGQGLNTKIGEGGIKISGGEKQRLAIARALLRQPDLIIFDEATSSLDSITEANITSTIREISQSRPSLMTVLIAHRLSTVMHADIIYVLEKGRIVEQGSHDSLLKNGGLYTALWRQQQASDI